MSETYQWSTTAASNNSSPPDGWPEDMAPSGVNNSGREMMAAIAKSSAGKVLTPLQFGANVDGTTDDTAALDSWLTYLLANGKDGFVPDGTYAMASSVTAALSSSSRITVSANAKFVAKASFPAGQRMFLISTGTGSGHVFEWVGGQFDATNQPNSGVGESNDIFSFNAENCTRCKIVLDETTAGADWLNSGSDSHLFIGGATNVHAEIGNCIGATDAGIYISSSSDGATGHSLHACGNFEKCNVGIIVKRLFETWMVEANVTDCITGVAGGTADNDVGATIAPGDGCLIQVNALRTERPCVLQAVAGGRVDVNAKHLGVSITGYTSTLAKGLYLSGSSRVTGLVSAYGVNAGCTKGTTFRAVDCDRRTLDVTDYDATDNLLIINCDDVGKAFNEDANSARNFFLIKENNVSSASTLAGTNSSMHRANPSSSGFEMDEPVLSLAGIRGAEALRVLKTASQVNYVQITGSTAGAANGVQIQGQGSDTDVPMTINPKGVGAMFLGGTGGGEAVRISKVASQVNAVQLTGAATGNGVSVAARGADTDVNLTVSSKGAGDLILQPNTGNIRIGKALVALGGGSAPTLGTIGGSGPATAGQNSWAQFEDSAGNTMWVPVWK